MNNILIKLQITGVEYGFKLPSSDSSVSVTISLFHSLPSLSLATLLAAAFYQVSSNEGGTLHIFRLVSYFLLSLFITLKTPPVVSTPEQLKANK